MAENSKLDQDRLLETIDLLLDGEAGAAGPRLQAEVEENEESLALYRYAQSVDLALKKAIPEIEPPPGMWKGLELQLAKEPVPVPSMIDWLQVAVSATLQMARKNYALGGTTFLFLLTCGTLWWDTSLFAPQPLAPVRWSTTTTALDNGLADQFEAEAAAALEAMIYDLNSAELSGSISAPAATNDGGQE